MNNDKYDELAGLFKALSHPTRVKIVAGLIKKYECNVTKMAENLETPQPTISQHINILKSAGIVQGFRNGNQICYRVNNELVKKLFASVE